MRYADAQLASYAGAERPYPDTQARLKTEEDTNLRRAFSVVMAGIADRLRYERDGLAIVVPAVPDEIIAEGGTLRTCVGSYVSRVVDGSCLILFFRTADNPETPLYTIEVRDHHVVQLCGQGNREVSPNVRAFVDAYECRVLARTA